MLKKFSSIENLIKYAKSGKIFVLVDDEQRENEGDLVFLANKCTPKKINFMAKYGRGLICLALDKKKTNQLGLKLMSNSNGTRFSTAFTVSIEARRGDQEMADMNFKNVYLYDQNNSLYASKNHPIFLNEEYNELDTLKYPWLCLFNTQQANNIINNYFELRDLPAPDLAIVSASIDFAFKMIEQHNFLACLPTPIVEENSEIGLRKVKLEDFDWSIPTGITYHKRYQSFAPLKQLLINLRKLSSA